MWGRLTSPRRCMPPSFLFDASSRFASAAQLSFQVRVSGIEQMKVHSIRIKKAILFFNVRPKTRQLRPKATVESDIRIQVCLDVAVELPGILLRRLTAWFQGPLLPVPFGPKSRRRHFRQIVVVQ